ncbi:cyclic nucleotide-binding domain-containing protein, putative [Eimeria mitis]|uniref:Cyclic nucleotide-binding domain-containing protein, putative n=1 Tax=Eimeria mitis TaxID=44415 RepID=U6KJP5_9EIME|nr:cyclic nucleotide-binding domain-containing protein, putative [Eimeria mitis]CDJ35673.1 cyclic nucleotide-binding domain-containing protein, putative [Eimeria mitis]
MGGQRGEKGGAEKTVSGAERTDSRGVMGWIRQSSLRRLRSREASRTPRDGRPDDNGEAVCTHQATPDNTPSGNVTGKGDHSLAAMFRSVPSRAKLRDETHEKFAQDGSSVRRAHTAQSLGAFHANSMVDASSLLHASSASMGDPRADSARRRSAPSDPGNLIDASDTSSHIGGDLPHSTDAKTEEKQTQKGKRIGSSSGLSRIGSFLSRSVSRHRSRGSRQLKGEGAPLAIEDAEKESSLPPVLSDAVNAPAALSLASLNELPDFSAADWLAKFEREEGGATSGVMTVCGGALEAVAAHLAELEKNIRLLQQNEKQQQEQQPHQQQQQEQQEEEDTAEVAQGVAARLAAAREQMDGADERVFSQIRYQGEQIILGELQQMIGVVKNIMHGIKYAAASDSATQHDLRGEEEQLKAWQSPCGALRENRNCLEALYGRVRSTRDEVLHNYHEECIRLNQSVQLLMDRIADTVREVFAEFEEPPSLEALYGVQEIGNQQQKSVKSAGQGAELRYKSSSSSIVSHQQAFGRLPSFIARLQLYAFNSPSVSTNGYDAGGFQKDMHTSTSGVQAARLFTPLTLQQCLPRKNCVKTVPPGLALMASQAEIERYEAQVWSGGSSSSTSGEGGFGSFRVFEQWLVDAMKWQWRDAFMYSKLQERQGALQQMIKEKQRDIQEAVCLRLKQLWWGRTVEMQAFYVARAAAAFTRDLQGVEQLHGVAAEAGEKAKEAREERMRGSAIEKLLLKNGSEAERAMMRAEDIRASVLRVVGNPAYRNFKHSLDELKARPSDAGSHICFLQQQIERAASLKRRFEDATEGKEGYETLEKECSQLEAALALLQEEAKTLENKLSFRQSQLSAKRQRLTQSLEQLSAAFDVNNAKLTEIEMRWDAAEKVQELIQEVIPSAEEIAACKQKLAEEKRQLEAEREEMQRQRQIQEEALMREYNEKLKQITASANASSAPVQAEEAANSASSSSSPHTAARLPSTPSKSFVGRLFGSSSRPSTPRKSNAAAHEPATAASAAATTEMQQRPATPRRRSSVDSAAQQRVSREEDLLPLKHGYSAPVHSEGSLHALKDSTKLADPIASQQTTNAEQTTHDLQGPPSHALSSPSLLTLEREERGTYSASSLAVATSPAEEKAETQTPAEPPHKEEGEGREGQKRKKSKSNAAGAGAASRRSNRKKKSMYSKLRSAFSLSHSSKKGSKEAKSPQPAVETINKAEEIEDAKGPAISKEAIEPYWVPMGSQSSVLATIPNIFDVEGEDEKDKYPQDERGTISPDAASAAFSLMVGTSSISDSSNQPAADEGQQQEATAPAASASGQLSGDTTLTFTRKGDREASPTFSLAESFRRASPERGQGPKERVQHDSSSSQPLRLSSGRAYNKFPSDPSVQEEDSPQFGSAVSGGDEGNDEEEEYEEVEIESNASSGARNKATEYRTQQEAGPLVPFPSLSAGSPTDFRSGVERHIIAARSPLHAEADTYVPSQRRRSDTAGGPGVYAALGDRSYGHRPGRAAAFDRFAAAAAAAAAGGFRRPSAAGLVDEDDRIELFLANSQPDLTTAVMSSSIFALLEPEERQHCIHLMLNSFVQIPKGCMLVQRGEKVDTLYFLVSGELGMTEPHAGAEQQPARTTELTPPAYTARRRSSYDVEVPEDKFPVKIGQGAFVLPRAFVREAQTNHSVMALRPCTLQKLSFHSFQQIISACIFRRASQVMSYLGHCPILDSLTKRERVQVATLMKWRIYLPDEVICFQGEVCAGVLIVVYGCARAVRFVERQGNPDVVDEFGPGDNINALALLHDIPSDVSVIAAAPDGCVVAVLERQELQDSLGDAEKILSSELTVHATPVFFLDDLETAAKWKAVERQG